jgi:predicted transcriptional regulator
MRTTVDLPPAARRRVEEIARERGQSISAVIAELALRGLAQLDEPVVVRADPATGFPIFSIGRRVTSEDVAEMLDEE